MARHFAPNYPFYDSEHYALLSVPERTGASPDYTGRGVVMAFIDSGFYPHPDLGNRILVHADASTSRIEENTRFREVRDHVWHGQMTSVIAAGDGRTSFGKYRGIASDARLVLIKVSNPSGHIKEPDILRGLGWLVENHRRFNVRIVNMSVGGDAESFDLEHPMFKAIHKLSDEGLIVLAAAGNSGRRSLVPPASIPQVITIGGIDDRNSLDQSLWRPYHNNYGVSLDGTRKPEVTAPAAWLPSPILPGSSMAREARWLAPLMHAHTEAEINRLLRAGYLDLGLSRNAVLKPNAELYAMIQARINAHKIVAVYHQHVDGTSVAVAVASSIVAQLLQANPSLTPLQVRAILTDTAQRLPNVSAEQQGAGVINAARAVAEATLSSPIYRQENK